jgi:hypothetical protein
MKANWFLSGLFIITGLLACADAKKKPSGGGPCTYEITVYPATVIHIKTEGTTDILFRVEDLNGALYRDSVSWFKEKNSSLEKELIEWDSIRVGKKYKYEIMKITTGSCDPKIEMLTLEEFD